jgi:hypothetical protein
LPGLMLAMPEIGEVEDKAWLGRRNSHEEQSFWVEKRIQVVMPRIHPGIRNGAYLIV